MTKNVYMKPVMNVVKIQQRHIICTSPAAYGMSNSLQGEEVDAAWSRGNGGWDDDE